MLTGDFKLPALNECVLVYMLYDVLASSEAAWCPTSAWDRLQGALRLYSGNIKRCEDEWTEISYFQKIHKLV